MKQGGPVFHVVEEQAVQGQEHMIDGPVPVHVEQAPQGQGLPVDVSEASCAQNGLT